MRSLSFSLWSNYNLFTLCCLIVLNTCQFVYSANNTTVFQCQCNSTATDPRNHNATNNFCNCTQDMINCTTGHHFQNGSCVKCLCNTTTTPTNCNCSSTQKPQTKLTCLPGQFLTNSSQGPKCENCNCSVYTSLNNNCNNRTGQCSCQQHTSGRDCTICVANFTANYSSSGELLNCLTSHSTSSTPTLSPSSQKTSSTYLSPSPSISIPHTTKLPPKKLPSPTIKSSLLTVKSPSTTIMSPSLTIKSPSTGITSPSTTQQPVTKVPLSTGKPVSTNTPQVSTNTPILTTEIPPTTDQESTTKPVTVTEHPPTQEPTTTKVHSTSEKMPSKDHKSDVVVVILVCLGVTLILGIAIAVGCWCLRVKRKPSTPMWTIELSNTRNEEVDFALMDPVTDEPHKKANDNSEADGPVTEHSRYYAYI